jgi:hypothetical protein
MGAAALVKSLSPWTDATDAFRGLLQLCFSMVPSVLCSQQQRSPEPNVLIPTQFVPCHISGITLPDAFFEMITMSDHMAPPQDKPAGELILTITRLVQLSAFVRSHPLADGQPKAANAIREVLELDAELDRWESRTAGTGIWAYTLEGDNDGEDSSPFPPAAVFRGRYHAYSSMWAARVWNHYRWARITSSQMIVEACERFPTSAASVLGPDLATRRANGLEVNRRMTLETLTSLPTHWRHPALGREHRVRIEKTAGGAGIGAAGIPTLLFQIKSVACAPGVPREYWAWGLGALDTIWRDTGMLQAKALADLIRKHGDAMGFDEFERPVLKVEPSDN